MSLWVPPRTPSEEILDGDVPASDAAASLRDIEWVHRNLGGRRRVRRGLLPLLEELGPGPVSLLDLGCGSGSVGRDLSGESSRRGRAVRVVGLDRKLAHAAHSPRGLALAGDAFRLPFANRTVDVVLSTLFLHHFAPEEVTAILAEARRVARRAVVAFDLSRHRAALGLIAALGPAVFESRISTLDGKASVRQAYTRDEIGTLAAHVLPGSRVEPAGAFVWRLLWRVP